MDKHNVCHYIKRHGPLVHASRNPFIFSTGTISCPLYVTLSGLLYAEVEVCVLEAFGMKIDMDLLEQVAEMQCNEPKLEERKDVGIFAKCSGIPLFSCITEGKVFPLLHMAGFGNGSVSLENDVTAETRVRTVIYPILSHHIKKPAPHFIWCPRHHEWHLQERGPDWEVSWGHQGTVIM